LLVADSFWEKSTAGWWLISRANRLLFSIAQCLCVCLLSWGWWGGIMTSLFDTHQPTYQH
jgi:hypothetical protein